MLCFRIGETAPPQETSLYRTGTKSGASWRRLRNLNFERPFPLSTVPIIVYNKFLVLLFTSSHPALSPFAPAQKGVQMNLVPRGIRPAGFSKSHACVSSWFPKAPCISLRRSGLPERKHQPPDHHRKVPDTQFRSDGFRCKERFRHTHIVHCTAEKDMVNK